MIEPGKVGVDFAGDPVALGLPHREPFVFLKRVVALEPGESGEAEQIFESGEAFFRGHFPGRPVVPGVLLTESVAQLAGIVAGAATPGVRFFLTAVKQMKFPAPTGPDELLRVMVRRRGEMGGLRQYEGMVRDAGGAVVAEGIIVLSEGGEE